MKQEDEMETILTDNDGNIKRSGTLLAHVRIQKIDNLWRTVGGNVAGLILCAPTMDEMVEKIGLVASDLLKANEPKKNYDGLLIDLVIGFEKKTRSQP